MAVLWTLEDVQLRSSRALLHQILISRLGPRCVVIDVKRCARWSGKDLSRFSPEI
ncbi:hypothetical protein M413DRAFT_440845 [Hebeloma cylindrosporum]|uniref:Uncharacterized protein n=1 Tax=Hebeloma cylindrosporum TaxID=76867 RepID=A0A0C2Y7I3_HEBCY|nr:hypothetical protein M413DRAFT_440845 [Hebeloma cylindrosporum h7]